MKISAPLLQKILLNLFVLSPSKASASKFRHVAVTRLINNDETKGGENGIIRSIIPQDLLLELYDAHTADERAKHSIWKNFSLAMSRFETVLGAGQFVAIYDREEEVAKLLFEEQGGVRIPAHALGSGVQQIISLLGRVTTSQSSILAIEEPELNLRLALQASLNEALHVLAGAESGPEQIIITSHSPSFEGGDAFYAMRLVDGKPVVEKRSKNEAHLFVGHTLTSPGKDSEGVTSCYVTSEGLVLLPEHIRLKLGVVHGGGVMFLERNDDEHVEILSDGQFLDLLSSSGSEAQ